MGQETDPGQDRGGGLGGATAWCDNTGESLAIKLRTGSAGSVACQRDG